MVCVKVWLPTVAVAEMTAVPCDTPVIWQTDAPVVPVVVVLLLQLAGTVAMSAFREDQTMPVLAIVWPTPSETSAVAFAPWFGAKLIVDGESVNTDDDVTVMLTAALRAGLAVDVAMIVVVPRATPVTKPVFETLAIAALLLVQLSPVETPESATTDAANWIVWPMPTLALVGVTVTVTPVFGGGGGAMVTLSPQAARPSVTTPAARTLR
jgi:hypothetical protein